jgi:PEGA domain
MDTLMYPSRQVPSMKTGVCSSCWCAILVAGCFLAWAVALPAGAVLAQQAKAVVAVQDSCANQHVVADFAYLKNPDTPEVFLVDASSACANRWQWTVSKGIPIVYTSPIISNPAAKNVVVTLPSDGTYLVVLDAGHDCSSCTNPHYDRLAGCCAGTAGKKTEVVTITAPTAGATKAPVQMTQHLESVQSLQVAQVRYAQEPQQTTVSASQTTESVSQTTVQSGAPSVSQAAAQSGSPSGSPAAVITSAAASAPSGQGPATTGAISITTAPPGAEIWIDNEVKGASPAVISGLSPGTHSLLLRKTGYQNISTMFNVDAGQTREYSSNLIQTTKSSGFSALITIGGILVLFLCRRILR